VENNGNFPILAFRDYIENEENCIEYKSSMFALIQKIKEKSERKLGALYGI